MAPSHEYTSLDNEVITMKTFIHTVNPRISTRGTGGAYLIFPKSWPDMIIF